MSTSSVEIKLNELGIRLESGKENLNDIVKTLQKDYDLSEKETNLAAPVLMYKAADLACLEGRNNITKQDFENLKILCVPHLGCWRSLIFRNKKPSALVISAMDDELLASSGIGTVSEIMYKSSSEIADRVVNHIREATPDIKIEQRDVDMLRKRAELWKGQAELIY